MAGRGDPEHPSQATIKSPILLSCKHLTPKTCTNVWTIVHGVNQWLSGVAHAYRKPRFAFSYHLYLYLYFCGAWQQGS
eukprot:1160162-Pelagomonas_calceolata.AAC.2